LGVRDQESARPLGAAVCWVRPFLALLATGLVLLSGFRLGLAAWRLWGDELSSGDVFRALWLGARLDLAMLALLLVPLAIGMLAVRRPSSSRFVLGYGAALLVFLCVFEVGGWFFFSYYDFRPNYLVLDYARDPEVAAMLLAQYPVVWMALAGIAGAAASWLGFVWLAGIPLRGPGPEPVMGWPARVALVLLLLAGCLLAHRGTLGERRINPSLAAFGAHRVQNEIAGSGIFNLGFELEQRIQGRYGSLAEHVELLPRKQALEEVRAFLPGRAVTAAHNPALRRIENPATARPLNVVLVVMESFTGRLVGSLGGNPALSPRFDELASRGLLLANCYATGERTIQGLEALVASFPSLPGVSVIRRPEARSGFGTLASVLKERGYETVFFYGGNASFDQMRGFFLGNGVDRVVEDRDFASPGFRGRWGVSDEDLFRRAHQEFDRRHHEAEPFFAVILTVSLHSPWEYPTGRIEELPEGSSVPGGFELAELNNFLYADWALGEFMELAGRSRYAEDTLFVFAADHGVHLRGRTVLPSEEYRVPVLFYAPGRISPQRIERVTSLLDVAPTTMGLLGGSYESPFFGSDVLADPDGEGFAPMIYRKTLHGVRAGDRLSVLAPTPLSYRLSAQHEISRTPLTGAHRSDARRALAVLQVAEDLLLTRSYTAH
jgi:phosphoglycerol transferase MdoB-like AlkP superfamily enzyme